MFNHPQPGHVLKKSIVRQPQTPSAGTPKCGTQYEGHGNRCRTRLQVLGSIMFNPNLSEARLYPYTARRCCLPACGLVFLLTGVAQHDSWCWLVHVAQACYPRRSSGTCRPCYPRRPFPFWPPEGCLADGKRHSQTRPI